MRSLKHPKGRVTSRVALPLAMLAVLLGGLSARTTAHAGPTSSLPPSFVTYPLSYSGHANDLRLGPDGRWTIPPDRGYGVDQMTTAGVDSTFQFPSFLSYPRITSGSDGNLWMYDGNNGGVDKLSPTGTLLATYPTPAANSGDIALGPDGNVWLTNFYTGQIASVTPAGVVTNLQWPPGEGPEFITAGPDGNVWVADGIHAEVGRITPSGGITQFSVPTLATQPQPCPNVIAPGPDGNLWYADPCANSIGRVTPSGVVTQFVAPDGIEPLEIATGPDGNLWFADFNDKHVGRITTAGQIGVFDMSSAGFDPRNIRSGPDGRMWLTLVALPFNAQVAAFQPFTPTPNQPDVRTVAPPYTLPSGGVQVTVTGYDVGAATQVLFGSTPATSFTVLGPGQVVATAPPHAAGAVDVTVVTPYGTTAPSTGSHYYYQATNCGTAISKSTQLAGDIGPCYTAALTVAADNVTLDLNGHGVVGFQAPRDGTVIGINLPRRTGVTISNGTVSGFDAGIHIDGGSGNTIANMQIHDNVGVDNVFTSQFGDGIMIEHGSSNNQIVHNVVDHNGVFDGIGIFDPGSDGNNIVDNIVENTVGPPGQGPAGEGIIINGASGSGTATAVRSNRVVNNVVRDNASGGISNVNHIGGTVQGNSVTGNGTTNSFGNGIGVQVGFTWNLGPTQMTIKGNKVSGNGIDGIRLGGARGFFRGPAEGNTIVDNSVTGNGTNPGADASENFLSGFRGYDLHDNDPTCGTNVWSKNTWGSAGYKPACTTAGGSGPAIAPAAAAPNAASSSSADATSVSPDDKAWEAFLERGRQ